jgi:hypothetical protein
MGEISETDWAYAAGFVDGEGCIAVTRQYVAKRSRFYYGVAVVVANRDINVLEWMRSLWGGCVVNVSGSRKPNEAPAWHWRAPTGVGAEEFLLGLAEYLRVKMPHCENALAMIGLMKRSFRTLGPHAMPAEWIAEQEAVYWKQRELNHRGASPFVRKSMHSPRSINRMRRELSQASS